MPSNIQTSLLTPVNGQDNGNNKQALEVWTSSRFFGATQVLALSATASVSTAYSQTSNDPSHVRVYGSNPFYLSVGSAPVATSGAAPFAASAQEMVLVPNGQKISVIQGGTGGNVWLTTVS